MKQGILRTILAISMSSLLNLATIGCSNETPMAPDTDNAPALSLSGRSSTDNDFRFVGLVVDIDVAARVIQFSNMTARITVAADAEIRAAGPQSTRPNLTLKDIAPGMYLDASGKSSDHANIILSRLVIVPADRYHAGFERAEQQ
ncbi:MAG: hypothetical protein WBP29_06295 [Candidatus Zixiibacteriota bacterium]